MRTKYTPEELKSTFEMLKETCGTSDFLLTLIALHLEVTERLAEFEDRIKRLETRRK